MQRRMDRVRANSEAVAIQQVGGPPVIQLQGNEDLLDNVAPIDAAWYGASPDSVGCVVYVQVRSCQNVEEDTFVRFDSVATGRSISCKKADEDCLEKPLVICQEFVFSLNKDKLKKESVTIEFALLKDRTIGPSSRLGKANFFVPITHSGVNHSVLNVEGMKLEVLSRAIPIMESKIDKGLSLELPQLRICLPRDTYYVGEAVTGMIVTNVRCNPKQISFVNFEAAGTIWTHSYYIRTYTCTKTDSNGRSYTVTCFNFLLFFLLFSPFIVHLLGATRAI
jgi:hypothetical protein